MALFPPVVTRNASGWFRLWLLLSFLWAAYASTIVLWPWQLQKELVAMERYPVDGYARPILSEHDPVVVDACQPGSISIKRHIDPPMRATGHNLGFEGEMALKRVEASGQRVTIRRVRDPHYGASSDDWSRKLGIGMVNQWDFPATITVSAYCDLKGAKSRAMLIALAVLFAIPIGAAIALLLALAVSFWLWRWLAEGFGAGSSRSAPMLTDVDVQVPVQDHSTDHVVTRSKSGDINKPLIWSAAIATFIDIFVRGALSLGKAGGTNMLVFGALAVLVFVAVSALGDRVAVNRRRFTALAIFWLGALMVMLVTTARYL